MVNFDSVSKVYKGDIVALNNVSFSLKPAEFCFIVGPSGAGKSTIIRLLIRQEFPSDGSILFEDVNVTEIPRKLLSIYRQQIGVVFQDLKLIPSKTVRENIAFALEITNKPKSQIDETTEYLLQTVNLTKRAHLYPEDLSGGEKQKVGIARALANDPKLLIADEPTGNLDPNTSGEILEILKAINEWGTTVLVVTHDRSIVDKAQRRVIHMRNGEIEADTTGGYDVLESREKREEIRV